ncbi:MAG: hypothetical protein Kow0090_14790 [Myxococcota bacterium]
MSKRLGVFLCRCGGNISGAIDMDKLSEYARSIEGVVFAAYQSFTCSSEGQSVIQEKIKEHNLTGVVIGCCTPKQYEELYRECIWEAGLNPYLLEMVNLREQCSYPHFHEPDKALEKAKLLLRGGLNKLGYLEPLETRQVKINRDVAVIGAGISGIVAASNLAKMKFNVHLIEKEPTVGGNMAKLVKTFPTDDCAMCTLSPRMDEVNKRKNINLMTYSKVVDARKTPEGYTLTVRRLARYVDEEKCTGCGKCSEVCPARVFKDFNNGIESFRPAIYKEFPSAVPNKFTLTKYGIQPCRNACPISQAVQGYVNLIARKKYLEAFRVIRRDNPLPAVCGRVCRHFCEDDCTRGNFEEPLSICRLKRFVADWAQNNADINELFAYERAKASEKNGKAVSIIGGGPSGIAAAHFLALRGFKVSIYEKQPKLGGVMRYGIPTYRLPDEQLDFDLSFLANLGVEFITGVEVGKDLKFEEVAAKSDAVYIALGLQNNFMLKTKGATLPNVKPGVDFLTSARRGEKPEVAKNILVIGGGNVAVDVARSLLRSGAEKVTMMCLESRDVMPADEEELLDALEEGVKIIPAASVIEFVEKEGKCQKVIAQKVTRIDKDENGRLKPILEEGSDFSVELDEVYIAIGQSPNFTGFPQLRAEVNSTRTNMKKVFMGGDVALGPTTIVEAMAQGKLAALEIAESLGFAKERDILEGFGVIDKEQLIKKLNPKKTERTQKKYIPLERRKSFEEVELTFSEDEAVKEAERCLSCGGCADCRLCEDVCEAKAIDYYQKDKEIEIDVGAVVLATGWKEMDPSKFHFGYGKYKNVVTQIQFARLLDPLGPTEGRVLRLDNREPAKKIVMVQCVGSRCDATKHQGAHEYCSRVCCMAAIKHAGLVKKYFDPDAEIYICYIDIRAFGKGYEEYFSKVKKMGVKFIKGIPGEVYEKDGKLVVKVEDAATQSKLILDADMLVLSSATEPNLDDDLIKKLHVKRDESGFIKEFHQKIKPTETMIKNIFVCGSAQGPKDIPDSIAQAGSAAANVAAYLGEGFITLNPQIAFVNEELCRACGRCEENCEFKAVKVNPERLVAEVESAMCEGCGKCSVICPTGAIDLFGFSKQQMTALVEGLRQ